MKNAEGIEQQRYDLFCPSGTKKKDAEKLKKCALECEKLYFEDFTFREGSIAGDIYNSVKDIMASRKREIKSRNRIPTMKKVNFKLHETRSETVEGTFDPSTNTITIHPSYNDLWTLLHEMIHAYNSQLMYVQAEILLVRLYNKLKEKIKNLDPVITAWAHCENQQLQDEYNDHAILFLLKSLDLDLRLNLPMGAIIGFYSDRGDSLKTAAGKIKIELG